MAELKDARVTTWPIFVTLAEFIEQTPLRTEREMLATKNFGKKSLNEIKEILNGMGLDFGMEFDEQGNPIPGSGGRDGADLSEYEGDEEQ